MALQRTIKVMVTGNEAVGFTASCIELPILIQAASMEKLTDLLQQAVAEALATLDPDHQRFDPHPALLLTGT
ncbi:MAG: hypothetical protein IMW91_04695 [Firmicutes bacterium]|nr:hypothetical protein [Bacillota bacterium]